jgi:hypothetical protein
VEVASKAVSKALHIIGIKNGARWFPGPPPADCNPDDPVSNRPGQVANQD